jgi:RHS repeat-associated protein
VTTTYGYDGDGWRATKSRAGQVTDYLRGPNGQLLTEVLNPGTSLVVVRDYIYLGDRLLAVAGGATPSISFTDPAIQGAVTPVRAVHITELRSAVNQYRAAAGLGAATWTDTSLSGGAIRAVHISELRTRLNEARVALGYAAATFTDPTLTVGSTAIRAVHLTELRAAIQQPGSGGFLRYYHTDALGSVRMTTDQAGNVVAFFDYQPFGEPLAANSESRRFTGAERDPETGFDYLGARYLHEGIGRFTQADEPGFGNPFDPQSMNLYGYARNNPLKYADPGGNEYVICGVDQYGFTSNCGNVTDAYFGRLEGNPGAGLRLSGGKILAGDRVVGHYKQTSVDPTWGTFAAAMDRNASAAAPVVNALAAGAGALVTGGTAFAVAGGGAGVVASGEFAHLLRIGNLQNVWQRMPQSQRQQLMDWLRHITGKNPIPGGPPPAGANPEAARVYAELARQLIRAGNDRVRTQVARLAALEKYFGF